MIALYRDVLRVLMLQACAGLFLLAARVALKLYVQGPPGSAWLAALSVRLSASARPRG